MQWIQYLIVVSDLGHLVEENSGITVSPVAKSEHEDRSIHQIF